MTQSNNYPNSKDPHVPLHHRGISLLSCVCKGYSSILNNHIVTYCEELNIFANEQNGFRKDKSCIDHIFTLTAIVRKQDGFKSSNIHMFYRYAKGI